MIRTWCVSFLATVALAACGRGGATATLAAPIQLAPGQSVKLEDARFEVQFNGIAADSRCPSDVACVWAGEVLVQLAIRNEGRTTQHEVREMQSATVGGYHVTVLQVLPPPRSAQRIAAADYRVTLKISR
jgi:uncharacterized lipoprotein YajG